MIRVKHTFGPPHICSGCYWEQEAKRRAVLNRHLRAELMRHTKHFGRRLPKKVESRHDDDERDVPDLLDEMSSGGTINLNNE